MEDQQNDIQPDDVAFGDQQHQNLLLALAKADHILNTMDQPASELLPEILLYVDLIEQLGFSICHLMMKSS